MDSHGTAGPDRYRVEHDTMGEIRVPVTALWRAQTQRAVENFPVSGRGLEQAQIRALGLIKSAAARANGELGVLPVVLAEAIAEVAEGLHDEQFPVDVFQTGSGTSSNMNANEVIATLAARRLDVPRNEVHPNDHVNASQSSNDVFPTSVHLAATEAVCAELLPALEQLSGTVRHRAAEWARVVKAGRTHLMDAVPITVGQQAGGWARQIELATDRLRAELPIGGTAVGTGLNAPAGFAASVVTTLARHTGLPLVEAVDHFEAQGARDGLVECSGMLRTAAISLYKITNDVRWMASGPRAGLGELRLPDLQPGSSIMPGKVNPVICEATMMVASQVIGNDACVAFAGSQGNFELNVMMPVMARNLLESIRLLTSVADLLTTRVFEGVTVDVDRCREYAESSPAIVTSLNGFLGYEEAAAVVKEALATRRTIKDVVLARGHVREGRITAEQLDEALDVLRMTGAGGDVGTGHVRDVTGGHHSER
jgi:fumarate hydratase class II